MKTNFSLMPCILHMATGGAMTTARQTPYLKEIMMGRCYENPPTTDPIEDGAAICSFAVDTVLEVLESQLDEDIDSSSYFMYYFHYLRSLRLIAFGFCAS